jgi:hypothetical protein
MCILVSLFDTFYIGYCINSYFSAFVFLYIIWGVVGRGFDISGLLNPGTLYVYEQI